MKNRINPEFFTVLVPFVRCLLVDIIIEPVTVKVVAVGTPLKQRALIGIIVRIVMTGHRYGKSLIQIPVILAVQCISVILGMSGDKDLFAALGNGQIYACLWRFRQYRQFRAGVNSRCRSLGMAAVRSEEHTSELQSQR